MRFPFRSEMSDEMKEADKLVWFAFFKTRSTAYEIALAEEDLSLMRLETRAGSSFANRMKPLGVS